jgi:hypothetical protein
MRFDRLTGKRRKGQFDTSSIVRQLDLKDDFEYSQIFFGEHLLRQYPNWPIAIVESEKTALVASLCKGVFPDLVWLASGSKSWLNNYRIASLSPRSTICFVSRCRRIHEWTGIAAQARLNGVDVRVSSLMQ